MTLNEAIALRLKEILRQKGITQYRLSQLSGIAESSISDICRQKCKKLSIHVVYELTDGLEMGIDEFFGSDLFKRENISD